MEQPVLVTSSKQRFIQIRILPEKEMQAAGSVELGVRGMKSLPQILAEKEM